ncbi:MAG: DUF805 domain-containing protein [Gammaproteobacteria bacterium]|nr:DUF805 domain-containing protein [Gammaproteobacteria bacterium]
MKTLIWLLFSFNGRIRRTEYWLFTLAIVVVGLSPAFVYSDPYSDEASRFVDIMALVFLWPALSIQAKRWHDRDKSAWWILINFVPIIGFIWAFIENGFLEGTSKTNRYGEPYGYVIQRKSE